MPLILLIASLVVICLLNVNLVTLRLASLASIIVMQLMPQNACHVARYMPIARRVTLQSAYLAKIIAMPMRQQDARFAAQYTKVA